MSVKQETQPRKYHTTREAAKMLGVHPQRLRRLFLAGELPEPARLGIARVLTAAEVETIRVALAKGAAGAPSAPTSFIPRGA